MSTMHLSTSLGSHHGLAMFRREENDGTSAIPVDSAIFEISIRSPKLHLQREAFKGHQTALNFKKSSELALFPKIFGDNIALIERYRPQHRSLDTSWPNEL